MSGSLTATDTLEENDPPTSKIELKWIRGFDGGYTVTFRLYFREQGKLNFQQINIGASPDNRYSLVGMKTETTYEFTIRAVNERGMSGEYTPYLFYTTKSMPICCCCILQHSFTVCYFMSAASFHVVTLFTPQASFWIMSPCKVYVFFVCLFFVIHYYILL